MSKKCVGIICTAISDAEKVLALGNRSSFFGQYERVKAVIVILLEVDLVNDTCNFLSWQDFNSIEGAHNFVWFGGTPLALINFDKLGEIT